MKRQLITRNTLIVALFAAVSIGVAACGKGGGAPTSTLPTPTVVPTYRYIPPTEISIQGATAAATQSAVATEVSTASAVALDPDKVALGKGRYVALECGSCHGEKGEGTPKGSSLLGMKLTQDQFVDFLRSGGKLGNDHLYSTNRLSDAGSKNLYVYVLSLNANK